MEGTEDVLGYVCPWLSLRLHQQRPKDPKTQRHDERRARDGCARRIVPAGDDFHSPSRAVLVWKGKAQRLHAAFHPRVSKRTAGINYALCFAEIN